MRQAGFVAVVDCAAEDVPEAAPHGAVGNGRSRVCDTKSTEQSDATYVLARLKRDRPDLAAHDGRTARLRAVVEAVVDFAAYGVGAPFRATTVQQDTQKPCETVRTSERRNPCVSGVFARNPLVGATPNTYPAYRPTHQHHGGPPDPRWKPDG